MPCDSYAALCRLPHPRHSPRSQKVSVPVLVVLGDDRAADWNVLGRRGPHAAGFPGLSRCAASCGRPKNERKLQAASVQSRRARQRRRTISMATEVEIRAPEGQMTSRQLAERKAPEREFVRFTRLQRTLHACMIVSFLSLALTGLSLKFSYTGWAVTLSHLVGGFQTAGFIHRTAALVMFGTFITHLVDLYRLKKQEYGSWRKLLLGPNTMLPTRQDWKQFAATMKWFVGAGPRPQYGR